MSKRTFVIFGILAAVLALLVPYWAINEEGSESSSPASVPKRFAEAKQLFQENCGSCHTLAKAGTDGVVGPDLDQRLGAGDAASSRSRVLTAIATGVGSGRMPAGILDGADAREVAEFVGACTGAATDC